RARDLHFPNVVKLVAVKEMINQARDPLVRKTIIRNFEREANLLATLDHRAIPRIYDYFSLDQRSYLVLEHISGKDLEALIADIDDFVFEDRVLAWALELCDVLTYLHNHKPEPIIFRDVKPSNIMITPQDHVVLVDFGIARTFQTGQKGTMIGTEGYSPPEQYRGEATPLADIYALGATLHHILTRRDPRLEPPFSFAERPIRVINPSISIEMEQVLDKALQYNPEDRFQTAQEMKEAFLSIARKTGLLNSVPTPLENQTNLSNASRQIWNFECEDELRGSATYHEGVLYLGSYDNNLYALKADDGKFLWKFPTEGGIVSKPAIFENHIYFGSADNRLYAVSIASRKPTWTYFTYAPIHSSPLTAEGHVFIGSDDASLHAVNALSGRRAWSVEAGAPVRSTPLIYNDSVYFGAENGEFFCVDFTGRIKWRFKARRAITGSPIINNGVVYFGSVDGTLYAMDAKTGWAIWRFRLNKPTITTPAMIDRLIFTGAIDGCIYCIDINNAKEVWRFQTDHQVTGSPTLYKDSIFCGSVDGHLYCLEYRTGRLRWKYQTQGPITSTPMANNDMVYVTSTDHHVYALSA
ncbi:MAG TPA: PQQ-binding-like beta-propeller repeat protein, partial [Anaerolineales bacterium]|nr:PQQ-binding-like beta-propeller repeat protein [Anaerolineales bacterium]